MTYDETAGPVAVSGPPGDDEGRTAAGRRGRPAAAGDPRTWTTWSGWPRCARCAAARSDPAARSDRRPSGAAVPADPSAAVAAAGAGATSAWRS